MSHGQCILYKLKWNFVVKHTSTFQLHFLLTFLFESSIAVLPYYYEWALFLVSFTKHNKHLIRSWLITTFFPLCVYYYIKTNPTASFTWLQLIKLILYLWKAIKKHQYVLVSFGPQIRHIMFQGIVHFWCKSFTVLFFIKVCLFILKRMSVVYTSVQFYFDF